MRSVEVHGGTPTPHSQKGLGYLSDSVPTSQDSSHQRADSMKRTDSYGA